ATINQQDVLLEAMYSAYFEKSHPLFSHDDLVAVATSAGLHETEIRAVLDSGAFKDEVIADRSLASQLGATGVPFFVVDMKYGISGAQPLEAFTQTLEAAWAEAHS
ncbi:MAG: DsbA family protein, partial [Candidatus Planktophila sp.]